jgi:hypothetical protein
MAMSQKTRTRQAETASRVLPAGTNVRTYVVGRANFRWTTGSIVAGALFVGIFVVGLLLGRILIPGALLILYFFQTTRPPRGIAVTDQGFAYLERSFWTGKPSKLIALLGPAQVVSSPLTFGPDRVTLSAKELDLLRQATNAPPFAAPQWSAPPPPSAGPHFF